MWKHDSKHNIFERSENIVKLWILNHEKEILHLDIFANAKKEH